MTIRLPLVFILVLGFSAFATCSANCLGDISPEIPFSQHFQRFGHAYLPQLHWHWFAAQARAESAFNERAVSPVGARGVMQLMPATFAEQMERLRDDCSPWSARCSIKAGIDFDRRMFGQWRRGRSDADRIPWMLAAYNAGLGGALAAQQRCGDPLDYADAAACMPAETRDYVVKIRRFFLEYSR